ncbi:MAG: 30S ribosomal protein S16 [Planctomycetes bacterium]|nr:30S ribosomal protein S16 [Planctomycetota bacterium]
MSVKIRLSRMGRKNLPYYRICVYDSRTRRDGMYLERLGSYDPKVKEDTKKVVVDQARLKHWLKHGARPTAALGNIFKMAGLAVK